MPTDAPRPARLWSAAYRATWAAALGLSAPYWIGRSIRRPAEMRERFGGWSPLPPGAQGAPWVHAASLGEMRAAIPLLRALRGRGQAPLVSVMTPTARACAGELAAAGALAVRYAPLDFGPAIRRTLRSLKPRALLLLETEIWPALLAATLRRSIPVAFVSARLSARGLRRSRRVRPLLEPLLAQVFVAAQSQTDAGRWLDLGASASRVRVVGNTKYEAPRGRGDPRERTELRRGWPRVVVLGSLRSGEIEAAGNALRASRPSDAPTLWVLAPRHPERTGRALARLLENRLPFDVRRAREPLLLPARSGAQEGSRAILVETIGELRRFYEIADLAFVGGTLVPIGGHNLFEVAELGVPLLCGPYTANVADTAELLLSSGGAREVRSGEEIAQAVSAILADPARHQAMGNAALAAARRLGGAVPRTMAALDDWGFPLGATGPPSTRIRTVGG